MSMRILLATHQFLPDFIGGTETLTWETAKELQQRGNRVTVWTALPADHPPERHTYGHAGVRVAGCRVNHRIGTVSVNGLLSDCYEPVSVQAFRRRLERSRVDIVHFMHLSRLSAACVGECVARGIPVLFTATDYWPVCATGKLLLPGSRLCAGPDPDGRNCSDHLSQLTSHVLRPKIFESRLTVVFENLRACYRVTVATTFMRDLLIRHGLERRKIELLSFGIDLSPFAGSQFKVAKKAVRIGFIGSLIEQKGAHVLLQAAKLLPKSLPLTFQLWGGAGRDRRYLERLQDLAHGDERVRLLGAFDPTRMARVLSGIDVLVVPSIWYENAPLVINAAQASRTPVIGSDVPGIAALVQNRRSGMTFDRGDAKQLAMMLKRVAERPALVEKLSRNAPQPTSVGDWTDRLEFIYKKALARTLK